MPTMSFWKQPRCWWLGAGLAAATISGLATAAESPQAGPAPEALQVAPVKVDGAQLFRLRGITSYPAKERAHDVRARILKVARDASIDPADISRTQERDRWIIAAGKTRIITLVGADAQIEDIDLPILAEVVEARIRDAIIKYRADRSPEALRVSGLYFLSLTAGLALLLWALRRLRKWLDRIVEARIRKGIEQLEEKSRRIISGGHIWRLVKGGVTLLYAAVLLLVAYFYLNSVLGAFPWTRGFALALLQLVVTPLRNMWAGLLDAIPNLMFLLVLAFIVRYVLRTLSLFAEAITEGRIQFPNFDADWAKPTVRIFRVAVIAFAVVVAYPYIPGSDSAAFKGVSLFLGLVFSLGSTSFISNMIAGVSMVYRGAYREGDWVRIGDAEGQVEDMRMMVMRLRSRKNECITIPNSVILNSNVINYSALGRAKGVILHTEVGIGYDTSWRQVESLLLEAAGRTGGVLAEPPPFVLQKALGDFAVTYELNALANEPARIPAIYAELHRNILDTFNEQGVQIMSPAYVADPASPKVVPPGQMQTPPDDTGGG